jgi:superfamily II DNA or RNA helicase
MSFSFVSGDKDTFLFDREELERIGSVEIVKQGLTCFSENRVISIDSDGKRLWASVEDEKGDNLPLTVQIEKESENTLLASCECTAADNSACLHIVAVLFAYADLCQENDGLMSAVDTAIKDRIKRAKAEVRVEAESGQPWFGSWRASSVNALFPRTYRVVIRSLDKRRNYCSCPDFAGNQLGTCKHIEAALHKIGKHPEHKSFTNQPPPFPYIYLSWEHEAAPVVCLHRTGEIEPALQNLFVEYFGADGTFTGRMPDDFFRFVELADRRGNVHIGEDALDWANHQARSAAQQQRSWKIKEAIETTRGRLPGINAKLYPYQVTGTAFLAGTGRALLADDMGLGKTLQAIAAATWLMNCEGVKKTLIICPASLKQQWAREIAKFTNLKSQIISGPPADRAAQYRQQANFFILNYELVLRDLSVITESLCPDLIIMDEAQRIKNWRTKIAAAVKLIPSRFAFVLTGTPLENRLEDLYSLMQVVDSKVLGPLWRYMVDFHVTDERGKVLGYRNLSLLRQRLQPVMLRRDRSLVNDQLPERINQRLDVAMNSRQVELHDDGLAKAGRLAQIAKRRPLTPTEQNRLIAALQQARMACNSAGLVDKESEESPKIDELEILLEEICLQEGRKAVVFSQWEMMTRMVEKRLHRMGLGFVRLHGGVPTGQRGALMDSFRDDDRIQVFVSTDAGGVGLNLQSGSALINLDVPWNPAVLEQRNARIHRLGQKRRVQIITMVAADSYEQQVLELVGTKQNLFDNVVKEDATEDVVGVSKKLLETLIENLVEEEKPPEPAASSPSENVDAIEDDQQPEIQQSSRLQTTLGDTRTEEAIRHCIEELQVHLGLKIERIFGARGGLICVLDRVDEAAEALAVKLSERVPVALIDHFALQGLSRLGPASPLAEAETYYDQSQKPQNAGPSKLQLLAFEKLAAARVLAEREMHKSSLELLLSGILAKAGDLAGQDKPIAASEAGVWIYSEALPNGLLNEAEANLLLRGIGLNQAEKLPTVLFTGFMQDAEFFIEQV